MNTEWQVLHSGDEQRTGYSASGLLNELIMKAALSVPTFDQEEIAGEFTRSLKAETVLTTAPIALMGTAFRLGYLYRVFLERNDVLCPASVSSSEDTTSDSTEL